jgi:hypothetical protein
MYTFKDLCSQLENAEIVMSTSWRDYITIEEWNCLFQFYGIKHKVVGKTGHEAPKLSSDGYDLRFSEIYEYTKKHKVKYPLAIDDFPLHALPSYKTMGTRGLVQGDVDKILTRIKSLYETNT